ncbi:uncharacterized protein N7483_009938 [Penicillium malachiteum]|uniref:uncharacterized protein n=1 Tax=Penicillium malachiteum TaxID=1324776 RepID=UPI0025482A96|nr:uncharacterized protein N7483_009938 [Penicillium malachiteum]KAJ5718856.1 hypothetical protein N7483_009938 [Penicillium malachiteum]
MATMDMGFLPTIKCSSCGNNVEISAMGDHVCAPVIHGITNKREYTNSYLAPIAPPSPPPSAGFESPNQLTAAMAMKPGRSAPPRIDPSIANRAFLQPNVTTPASSIGSRAPSPLSTSAPRSPLPSPGERISPDNESVIDLDSVFSFPMPGNRDPTRISAQGLTGNARNRSPAPTPSPRLGLGLDLVPENIQLPPSPLPPPPRESAQTQLSHQRWDSMASHSSYRTSMASTRYGSSTARSSTHSFSRGFRTFMDETPPLPPAPLRTPNKASFPRDSNLSVGASYRAETYSGFDFGITTDTHTSLDDLPEEHTPSMIEPTVNHDQFFDFSNDNYLHPTAAKSEYEPYRKNSDATSEGALSITSFARALGLEDHIREGESSLSSESSTSETHSGSSMSSLPSDVSLTRHKPTDPLNLEPLVEEMPARTRQTILELPERRTLDGVPTIPAAFFSPDSPTDPAITQGSLSLIVEKRDLKQQPEPAPEPEPKEPPSPRPIQRSATLPIPPTPNRPPTRSATRSKGQCKGCGEAITGKSISSSDGRLTGRYHRGCFVCFECHSPFQTADFYVLNNRPYCAQHYHERNGSLCSTCNTGIEGQYLETVEPNPNKPSRRRFHPTCLQCRTCHVLLNGDYFEWNGEVYCDRDARRAAAAAYHPPPAGRRRPPGSSPLAQSRSYGPPSGRPPPSSGPGQNLRPGPRFPSGGARRFPERRTTKLMMF